jgi:hypothetical protein
LRDQKRIRERIREREETYSNFGAGERKDSNWRKEFDDPFGK